MKKTMYLVVIDMASFLALMIYTILGLSLMLFSIRATQADLQNYSNFLGYAFLASIGEYNSYTESSDNFDALSFIIFIMISIVNTIIMMNLLISIISDTYDKVQLRIGVANLIELIKMTVEVESILY